MPLLIGFRRFWAVLFFLVLLLPAVGLVVPGLREPPRTVDAPMRDWWIRASERLDPFVNDAFGFRAAVLQAHASWGYWLGGGGNRDVAVGADGALFFKGDDGLAQSYGELRRRGDVRRTADFVAALDDRVEGDGVTLVVVVPPNSQTIRPEALATRTRAGPPYRTEYDLMKEAMQERGVTFVDLRPVLAEAGREAPVYRRNDTHWNVRGAIVAFNAAMAAAGRSDLVYADVDGMLGPLRERWDGDLVRMLGLPAAMTPDMDNTAFPAGELPSSAVPIEGLSGETGGPSGRVVSAYDLEQDGPRIMVIGDSFTRAYWRRLLAGRASAMAWMHHESCAFDQGVIERFRPDILLYAPVERSFLCSRGGAASPENTRIPP